MKNYTIKELIELSHTDLDKFANLEEYFTVLVKLTGRKEYKGVYEYVKSATAERLSKEIVNNLICFVSLADYEPKIETYVDEDDDERERKLIVISEVGYEISSFHYKHIEYLLKEDDCNIDYIERIVLDFTETIDTLETEAYQAICKVNEKNRLAFELENKEQGVIRKILNKI